ncbi:Enteropeptidase [Basidiobolus ranarum]|uniref:Enteropeptidase n=1 Tax=Basidiobolus ranarum TaxID=34480 RepID=A0ABR2WV97_9FUNG
MRLNLLASVSLALVGYSSAVDNWSNIVGGKPVAQNGLPFMAHLIIENKPECGGALIGDKWVITAAHCLVKSVTSIELGDQLLNIPSSQVQVILGTIQSNSTSPYTVARYSLAPDFDYLEYRSDLAILELTAPVQISDSIRPIGISQQPIKEKQVVTAAGWGATETQNFSDTLYEVNLEVGTEAKCTTVVPQYQGLNGPKICVANRPGSDTCFGDSGGPLFQQENGHFSILGVTSYGPQKDVTALFKCGGNDTYGVYTRLVSFNDFIKNVTGLSEEQMKPGYYSASSSGTGAESTKNSEKNNTTSNSTSDSTSIYSNNLVTAFVLSSISYLSLSSMN